MKLWPETIVRLEQLWKKLDDKRPKKEIPEYGNGDTAKKIINIMKVLFMILVLLPA